MGSPRGSYGDPWGSPGGPWRLLGRSLGVRGCCLESPWRPLEGPHKVLGDHPGLVGSPWGALGGDDTVQECDQNDISGSGPRWESSQNQESILLQNKGVVAPSPCTRFGWRRGGGATDQGGGPTGWATALGQGCWTWDGPLSEKRRSHECSYMTPRTTTTTTEIKSSEEAGWEEV